MGYQSSSGVITCSRTGGVFGVSAAEVRGIGINSRCSGTCSPRSVTSWIRCEDSDDFGDPVQPVDDLAGRNHDNLHQLGAFATDRLPVPQVPSSLRSRRCCKPRWGIS